MNTIISMNHSPFGELHSIEYTALELLDAERKVAASMQAQPFPHIAEAGWVKEGDVFVQLVELANTDPEHIATAPVKEQTYNDFQTMLKKYAPRPLARKDELTCDHRRAYGNKHSGMMVCPECGKQSEPQNDFKKRLCAPHRGSCYVNYGIR